MVVWIVFPLKCFFFSLCDIENMEDHRVLAFGVRFSCELNALSGLKEAPKVSCPSWEESRQSKPPRSSGKPPWVWHNVILMVS